MAIPNKKLPYLNDNNAINLTTAQPSNDNKVYIIDKRLLDELLNKVTNGSLSDMKEDIILQVKVAKDKDDIFKRLDDYIYLNNIVDMLPNDESDNSTEVVE